jgi:hypothetical protein
MKHRSRTRDSLLKEISKEMVRTGHVKVGLPLLQRYYYDGTMVAMMATAG